MEIQCKKKISEPISEKQQLDLYKRFVLSVETLQPLIFWFHFLHHNVPLRKYTHIYNYSYASLLALLC